LAQIGHESGSLAHLKEIWGPTDQQRRYEPPSNLAARLGNDTLGDGFRFRGRGLIQITGRSNYEQVGAGLGVDLIRQPELLEEPDYAVASACWWWQ
jgi:putative chitinase